MRQKILGAFRATTRIAALMHQLAQMTAERDQLQTYLPMGETKTPEPLPEGIPGFWRSLLQQLVRVHGVSVRHVVEKTYRHADVLLFVDSPSLPKLLDFLQKASESHCAQTTLTIKRVNGVEPRFYEVSLACCCVPDAYVHSVSHEEGMRLWVVALAATSI